MLEMMLLPIVFGALPLGAQALGITTLLVRFQPLGNELVEIVFEPEDVVELPDVLFKMLETMIQCSFSH